MARKRAKGRKGASAADRTIRAPRAIGTIVRTRNPQVRGTPRGIIIRHREFVERLTGSDNFAWDGFSINPGLEAYFPWLSAIASRYERYRFKKLAFEFVPAVSASTTGRVVLGIDFDPADAGPEDYAQVVSYHLTCAGPVWNPLKVEVSMKELANEPARFNRYGVLATNLDVKTYDLGNLYMCTQDFITDGGAAGDIFVDYEVEFLIPQMEKAALGAWYSCNSGCTAGAPLGVNGTGLTRQEGNINLTTDGNGAIKFLEPFEGILSVSNTGTAIAQCAVDTGTSCEQSALLQSTTGSAATTGIANFAVRALKNEVLKLLWGTATGISATTGRLYCVPGKVSGGIYY